jgi:hypothetical protein
MASSLSFLGNYLPRPLFLTPNDPRAHYLGTEPSADPIFIIFLSFLLHFLLFYIIPIPGAMISKQKPVNSIVLRNYLMSTFHAMVCNIYILTWYYFFDRDLTSTPRLLGGGVSGKGDEYTIYLIGFSLGYFVYDTLAMLLYPKQLSTPATYIHHFVVGACLVLGVYFSVGHHAHFLILLEELSTPFLNLKTLYKHHKKLRKFFEIGFVLSFAGSRLGYGTWIWSHCALRAPEMISEAYKLNDTTSVICCCIQVGLCGILRILNIYWMGLIIKKVIQTLKGKDDQHILSPRKMD